MWLDTLQGMNGSACSRRASLGTVLYNHRQQTFPTLLGPVFEQM